MNAQQIAQVAQQAGFSGTGLVVAVAIALAESGGDPQAVSPTADYGLWQLHLAAHPDVSMACALDAGCCAQAAYRLSSGGADWTPWATFSSGAYRRYLAVAQQAAALPAAAPAGVQNVLIPGAVRWGPFLLVAAGLAAVWWALS